MLSDAQWEAAAGFNANADPLYGGDTAQDFKALFSRIVNQTPAPQGLGAEDQACTSCGLAMPVNMRGR